MRIKKYEKDKEYDRPYYYSGDVTFTGKIEPGYLADFTKESMDMLIVLEEQPDPLTKYILSHTRALKIGCSQDESIIALLDLIVHPSQNTSKCNELINYLRKIA